MMGRRRMLHTRPLHRGGAVRRLVVSWVATLGTATATATVDAQQWTWPERAQDLREPPADFPPERLRAVMTGVTSALGVRCSHCHVGEEGRPLATYDFVSDANPDKG